MISSYRIPHGKASDFLPPLPDKFALFRLCPFPPYTEQGNIVYRRIISCRPHRMHPGAALRRQTENTCIYFCGSRAGDPRIRSLENG